MADDFFSGLSSGLMNGWKIGMAMQDRQQQNNAYDIAGRGMFAPGALNGYNPGGIPPMPPGYMPQQGGGPQGAPAMPPGQMSMPGQQLQVPDGMYGPSQPPMPPPRPSQAELSQPQQAPMPTSMPQQGGDQGGMRWSGNLTDTITQAAKNASGGDPRKETYIRQAMEGIRAGESGHGSHYDHNAGTPGHPEDSWGPFQLNRHRGMGVDFQRQTGLNLADPRTIPAQAKFVAEHIARGGSLEPWRGYRGQREADPKWGNSGFAGAQVQAALQSPEGRAAIGGKVPGPDGQPQSGLKYAVDLINKGSPDASPGDKMRALALAYPYFNKEDQTAFKEQTLALKEQSNQLRDAHNVAMEALNEKNSELKQSNKDRDYALAERKLDTHDKEFERRQIRLEEQAALAKEKFKSANTYKDMNEYHAKLRDLQHQQRLLQQERSARRNEAINAARANMPTDQQERLGKEADANEKQYKDASEKLDAEMKALEGRMKSSRGGPRNEDTQRAPMPEGAPPAQPQNQNITQDEYAKLPKGAKFWWNGQQHEKQ